MLTHSRIPHLCFADVSKTSNLVFDQIECIIRDKLVLMRNVQQTDENIRIQRVPVWVKLYNVPLEYWTVKGLSCVASAIGIPLHADLTTLLRKRLSYARVCVEI